jgi:hypothetical protein
MRICFERPVRSTVALLVLSLLGALASAGPREQAQRMHQRIAGVPPTAAVLASMAADIAAGRAEDAALTALQNPSFYNVTLKNFVTPWTNEERSVFAPLNDYTATVIGMVRDDVPFDQVLSGDILYTGRSGLGLPPVSATDNDHFEQLERAGVNLKDDLQRTTQSAAYGTPSAAAAGVLTTRAAARAFLVAGTNRAMLRFTFVNHLCRDLEQIHDTSRPPDRIRQDVSRSPGGDSRLFLNNCIGCHAGLDPMAQAFAYYDYDESRGRLVYTAGQVQPKHLINSDNFKAGYVTTDDRWTNYWRRGQNALLGWDPALPGSGAGASSLGAELAGSDAFASCQAQKVFRAVCLRVPNDAADRQQVAGMTASFRNGGYRMKQLFSAAAVYCMGP